MSLNTFYQSIIKFGKNLLSPKKTKNFNYYKLNADQGDTEAQYNLANCYFIGNECEKNLSEAFRYYKSAVDNGYAVATGQMRGELALARLYDAGLGVAVNQERAAYYYQLAASTGNLFAKNTSTSGILK